MNSFPSLVRLQEQVVREFRYFYPSNLIRAGVPLRIVARWLGDTESAILSFYSHMFPDEQNSVPSLFGREPFILPFASDGFSVADPALSRDLFYNYNMKAQKKASDLAFLPRRRSDGSSVLQGVDGRLDLGSDPFVEVAVVRLDVIGQVCPEL
jgi:hypothetical protein